MKRNLGLVGMLVLMLTTAACGGGQSAGVAQGGASRAPTDADVLGAAAANSGTPITAAQIFNGPELGEPRYQKLIQEYGAPNTNFTLNPKATWVSLTASKGTVQVQPDALVFSASDARWVLNKKVGDVLVCDQTCTQPFLRKVVSISKQGDSIRVATVDGHIQDVVERGWIHITAPVQLTINSDGVPGQAPVMVPHYTGSGSYTVNAPTISLSPSVSLSSESSGVGGSLGVKITDKLSGTVTMDIATSWFTVTEFSMKLKVTNAFSGSLSLSVKQAIPLWKKELKDWEIPIGTFYIPLPVGAIPVEVVLPVKSEIEAEAEGKIALKGSYSKTSVFQTGFQYTDANGFSAIEAPEQEPGEAEVELEGEAGAEAALSIKPAVFFKMFYVAGPELQLNMKPGVEASVSKTVAPECKAKIQGDFFFSLGGSCDAALSFHKWGINVDKDLGKFGFTILKLTYPNPPLSKDITKYLCPAEPDAGESCRCNDGSACPNGDKAQCAAPCACADGTVCPNGDKTQCAACTCDNGSACPNGNRAFCSSSGGAADGGTNNSCGADLQSDPNNCGQCGYSCWNATGDPNSTCQAGSCSCTCPDGSSCPGSTTNTCCDPNTSNLSSDNNNCGACGHVCLGQTQCVNGSCVCPPNATCA